MTACDAEPPLADQIRERVPDPLGRRRTRVDQAPGAKLPAAARESTCRAARAIYIVPVRRRRSRRDERRRSRGRGDRERGRSER